MFERQVSVSCMVASIMWAVTFVVWGVSWIIDVEPLMTLSILCGMIAATATVRTYFVAQSQRIKTAIAGVSIVSLRR